MLMSNTNAELHNGLYKLPKITDCVQNDPFQYQSPN
jgi:hypothetical protein